MKSNIISKVLVISMMLAMVGIAPAAASVKNINQNDEKIPGVVKSQTVFAGDNGQAYLIIGTNDNLGMYIGKKVIVDGLVTPKSSGMAGENQIRIEHIDEIR